MSMATEDAPTAYCAACGSVGLASHYAGLLRCRDCTHVQADLRVSDEELALLYSRKYFFGDEYSDYIADKRVLQRNFERRMRVLGKYLDGARHRRLLEVGCAYGWFLDLIRDRFQLVQGIDIAADGVRYARSLGLDAIEGDLLRHSFGSAVFDVICIWDSIEHLRDPDKYLARISELTSPGALLALTTGDIGSLNARLKGSKWRLIHPPSHLHYFTRKSMEVSLDRAGFEIVHFEHCGFSRSVELVSHSVFVLRHPRLQLLHGAFMKLGLGRLMFYSNFYDIMYVIARRR
jgi:SAM-dependent methyltransferase